MKRRIFLLLLLLVLAVLMVIPAWFDSAVYNENGRLASGLYYLHFGEYSIFRVNPPLTGVVGAFPSLVLGAEYAKRSELDISDFKRVEYPAGDLFAERNTNYRILLFIGRIFCIVLLLAIFTVALSFSSALYGNVAMYFLIAICFFSPYFLGHGHLIAPDAISGASSVFAVYFFWRWLRKPSSENSIMAGLALGLAELTKFTLLVFYPVFSILWILYRFPRIGVPSIVPFRKQLLQCLQLFAVSLLVINLGYMFEGTGKQLRSFRFQTKLFTGYRTLEEIPSVGGNRFDDSNCILENALGYLPMPLPKNFVQGIDTQRLDFERGMPSYLRGEWSNHGWWYYYLYAILLKNPLGTIGLFLLALFCTLFLKGYNADLRDEAVILLPGISLLVFVSSQTGFSVHSRYMIPALPFFFLWSTKVARAFTSKVKTLSPKSSRAVRWIAVILVVWSVGSSLWVYPHSIAYFNELAAILPTPLDQSYPHQDSRPDYTLLQKVGLFLNAGPINGPRHLLDSNIDWGQDLYGLERWCRRHPELHELTTVMWNGSLIKRTSIPVPKLGNIDKTLPQWYAISVNRLYDEKREYRNFLNFTPEAVIGYTTYIYRIPAEKLECIEKQSFHEGDEKSKQ